MKAVVGRLRELDTAKVDTAFEEDAFVGADEKQEYVPWRGPGVERLLMKLDFGRASEEDMEEDTKDAAIIAAAQRVEHYEISGYGTARTYANLLGENEAVELLEETLEEEKETDQKLTQLAEEINVEAAEGSGEEEEGDEEQSRPSRARTSSGSRGRKRAA